LAAAIRAGGVSAAEVLEAHLAQIDTHNPTLNAIVTLEAEHAYERPRQADAALARGEIQWPLHGVPFTLKDVHSMANMRTTAGFPRLDHVPKEGSSAGVTIVTGIVSALKKQQIRNDLAMTGEITIMGKVLAVGGIQQKIRAAYDAGVKEVLLPADNLKEARELPSYILDAMKLTPVQTVDEVLRYALVDVVSK
jgi:hypothetical protein